MITRKPVVLLAPLDWGLGHTVRCIPLISELLRQECEVIVACNSKQKLILNEEFPLIHFIDLPGYEIYYGKTRFGTIVNIFFQIPKIVVRIKREKAWLNTFLRKQNVSVIISDNRYGFFSATIPSIFITHQLRVNSGMGTSIDGLIQKLVYSLINRFAECWIPDWKDTSVNAAGALSHPVKAPAIPVKYLGCLSRFEKCADLSQTCELLIILSGPEPQRSILENILMLQLKTYSGNAIVVRGVFDTSSVASFNKTVFLNYLPAKELNRMICSAQLIICRAGYTSIMDILKLGKKSILIPTPGQAEQEYLGTYMKERKLAYYIKQEDFQLKTALKIAQQNNLELIDQPMDGYKQVIGELVTSIKKALND